MRRTLLAAAILLPVAACGGAGDSFVDSAFPISRMSSSGRLAGVDTTGFTVNRVLGRPDGLEPLLEDTTILGREADGRSLRDLLDVEGTRPNIFEQNERQQLNQPTPREDLPQPRTRGSSTPPRAELRPEVEPGLTTTTRPEDLPQRRRGVASGSVIPSPQGGTVAGGSVGNTTQTIGPSGQTGTAVRDGNTVTLFGADGSIRTVPAPAR